MNTIFDVFNKALAIKGKAPQTPEEIVSMFNFQIFRELYMPLAMSIMERAGDKITNQTSIDETIQMANEEEIDEFVERILERI
jgi:hypothetical protein